MDVLSYYQLVLTITNELTRAALASTEFPLAGVKQGDQHSDSKGMRQSPYVAFSSADLTTSLLKGRHCQSTAGQPFFSPFRVRLDNIKLLILNVSY